MFIMFNNEWLLNGLETDVVVMMMMIVVVVIERLHTQYFRASNWNFDTHERSHTLV